MAKVKIIGFKDGPEEYNYSCKWSMWLGAGSYLASWYTESQHEEYLEKYTTCTHPNKTGVE